MTKKKIKDLALYEVFKYGELKCIRLGNTDVATFGYGNVVDLRRESVWEEEVEVLGKMVFVEDKFPVSDLLLFGKE